MSIVVASDYWHCSMATNRKKSYYFREDVLFQKASIWTEKSYNKSYVLEIIWILPLLGRFGKEVFVLKIARAWRGGGSCAEILSKGEISKLYIFEKNTFSEEYLFDTHKICCGLEMCLHHSIFFFNFTYVYGFIQIKGCPFLSSNEVN